MRLIIKSLQSWVTTIQFNYIACCFPVHLLSIKPFLHFLAAAVASGHHLITGPLGHPTHATLECIKGTRGSLCSSYPCLRWGVGAMRYISGMTGGIYDFRDILCVKNSTNMQSIPESHHWLHILVVVNCNQNASGAVFEPTVDLDLWKAVACMKSRATKMLSNAWYVTWIQLKDAKSIDGKVPSRGQSFWAKPIMVKSC